MKQTDYLTIPVSENGVFEYTGKLVQADGTTPIPANALQTLTFTIIDVLTGVIINGRNASNALNANGFVVDTTGMTGNLSWVPFPADNPIVSTNPNAKNGDKETHEVTLTWTWLDLGSRLLQQQRKIFISVEKYAATEVPIQPGVGASPVTLNFGLGAEGIQVWLSTDDRGLNRVGGTLVTDVNGRVVFNLTAGAQYYLWTSSPNYEPYLGQLFVAVADS